MNDVNKYKKVTLFNCEKNQFQMKLIKRIEAKITKTFQFE